MKINEMNSNQRKEYNMKIYNLGKEVPEEALKKITFGRLKGKSSIDPMWRIQKMTEIFGAKGEGWKTKKVKEDFYKNESTGETIYTIEIELFYRIYNEDGSFGWSEAVEGTGSHYMFKIEKSKLVFNDEFKKMARTDAEGNAMKSLGIGGNVYMGLCDGDKYQDLNNDSNSNNNYNNNYNNNKTKFISDKQQKFLDNMINECKYLDEKQAHEILKLFTGGKDRYKLVTEDLNKFKDYIKEFDKQDINLIKTNIKNATLNHFNSDNTRIVNFINEILGKKIKFSEMNKFQLSKIELNLKMAN